MRFTIHLEAGHHPLGSPTDPKLGQKTAPLVAFRNPLFHLRQSFKPHFVVDEGHMPILCRVTLNPRANRELTG